MAKPSVGGTGSTPDGGITRPRPGPGLLRGFPQAYGEGGDVVVQASSAVAEEVAVKSRQQLVGRRRGLSAHPGRQREEPAVAGAGLGDPVGVEKQQVAGGEVEGVDGVVIADQLREVEQRRGGGGFEGTEFPAVPEQRRRVSAVEDLDTPAVVRDLDKKGRGEALHRTLGGKAAL